MRRLEGIHRFAPGLVLLLTLLVVGSASAQLRPLEPTDWDALDTDATFGATVGGSGYLGQRVSLAGVQGSLYEVGNFGFTWRLGQVVLRYAGSALRVFDESSTFATPRPGTRAFDGGTRVDAGDHRASTLVRFSGTPGRVDTALRFGVRLPTTNNEVGLGRDQTDFFATFATRFREGPWWLAADLGFGIYGTREVENEQVDPLIFGLEGRYALSWGQPYLIVLAQRDTRPTPDRRGTEDLGEGRVGVAFGEEQWLRVEVVRGWEAFSPDFGVRASVGLRR